MNNVKNIAFNLGFQAALYWLLYEAAQGNSNADNLYSFLTGFVFFCSMLVFFTINLVKDRAPPAMPAFLLVATDIPHIVVCGWLGWFWLASAWVSILLVGEVVRRREQI